MKTCSPEPSRSCRRESRNTHVLLAAEMPSLSSLVSLCLGVSLVSLVSVGHPYQAHHPGWSQESLRGPEVQHRARNDSFHGGSCLCHGKRSKPQGLVVVRGRVRNGSCPCYSCHRGKRSTPLALVFLRHRERNDSFPACSCHRETRSTGLAGGAEAEGEPCFWQRS